MYIVVPILEKDVNFLHLNKSKLFKVQDDKTGRTTLGTYTSRDAAQKIADKKNGIEK